ncbi:MAG TPA: efflux RND transporter periplasmic adaptor subunit [Bryobacteraceae bacterium]|nr:efflux RND transporter periplasmic adaptor subunit [Bryobacteraceae bacterium]
MHLPSPYNGKSYSESSGHLVMHLEPMLEKPRGDFRGIAPARARKRAPWLAITVLLSSILIVAFLVTTGIRTRLKAATAVKLETQELATPVVSVIHPKLGSLKDEVVLPGNIQAYTDSPIYARASGYLKKWYVDIGGRVKAGQLLAEIEAPEVDQQVLQAKASLQQAEAALEQAKATYQQGKTNEQLARVTAERWQKLAAQGAVSRQENDTYQAQYQAALANSEALQKAIAAAESNVASSKANLSRLQQLQGFELVKAPFDGVITARNTDVGVLINSGNGGAAQELFHMAATNRLRVYINVPQIYSRSAVPGVTADLTLAEFPGRHFKGTLVRTAQAIDTNTRTLLTEIAVDNSSGELLPGAYAQVHLRLPDAAPSLVLPVNALIFRSEGLQVAVVRPGGKAELVPITLGKDYGTEVEVTSGLQSSDLVIANPPDSLTTGTVVRVSQ